MVSSDPNGQTRSSSRNWWRSPLPWGVLASLAVAFIPFVIDTKDTTFILSILVALTGIILTLLLDPLLRLQSLQENASFTLGKLLSALELLDFPPSLLLFTKDLYHDWQSLETDAGAYRQTLLRAYAQEAKSRIHSIAQGRQERASADPNNFRAAPLDIFRTLKALTSTNFSYWNQPHGREYLERQRTAIAIDHLEVERIFVLGPSDITSSDVRSIIETQLKVGIAVRVLVEQDVLNSLRPYAEFDFALVTDARQDKMLFKPISIERESISFSPDDIVEYQNAYDELRKYSRAVDEVLQLPL